MQRVTQRTIAESLGLDTSTVSLALGNDPRVRAATRRKVLAEAERLGYRRDPMVSALMRTRRTAKRLRTGETIAFLHMYPRLNHTLPAHIGPVFSALRREGLKAGYAVEPFRLDAPGMSRKRLREILLARGVRKLVIASPPLDQKRVEFDWEPFSLAAFDYVLESPGVDRVVFDHFHGMIKLLKALREAGRHRVAPAFDASLDERVLHLWSGAFYAWREQLPRQERMEPFIRAGFSQASLEQWLKRQRPDTLLSVGRHAPEMTRRLQAAGWRVPEELLVVNLNRVHQDEVGLDRDFAHMARALIQLLQVQDQEGRQGPPDQQTTIMADCHVVWPGAKPSGGKSGAKNRASNQVH